MRSSLFIYTLHLADNALILGQRNSEWCGHGPVLEQDIAITNISLDLLGQARSLLQYAAETYNLMTDDEKKSVDHLIPRIWKKYERDLNEDDLAFLREENQYLNILLCELPKGDWGMTILKQFFFSSYQQLLYSSLLNSSDKQIAAIAEKSLKEVAYHLRWSSEWVIRLGDGTEESHQRINASLEELWPFTGEVFLQEPYELEAAKHAITSKPSEMKEDWTKKVQDIFDQANLSVPSGKTWSQSGGKKGQHTEYLGYVLAEMQYLQRAFPDVTW